MRNAAAGGACCGTAAAGSAGSACGGTTAAVTLSVNGASARSGVGCAARIEPAAGVVRPGGIFPAASSEHAFRVVSGTGTIRHNRISPTASSRHTFCFVSSTGTVRHARTRCATCTRLNGHEGSTTRTEFTGGIAFTFTASGAIVNLTRCGSGCATIIPWRCVRALAGHVGHAVSGEQSVRGVARLLTLPVRRPAPDSVDCDATLGESCS